MEKFLLCLFLSFASHEAAAVDESRLQGAADRILPVLDQQGLTFVHSVAPIVDDLFESVTQLFNVKHKALKLSKETISKLEAVETKLGEYSSTFRETVALVDESEKAFNLTTTLAKVAEVLKLIKEGLNGQKQLRSFLDTYNSGLIILSDTLFSAFSDESGVHKDHFTKVINVTHAYPSVCAGFSRGAIQLMLQVMVVDLSYLLVSGKDPQVLKSFQHTFKERIDSVVANALRADRTVRQRMKLQLSLDQQRLQKAWKDMNHCRFSSELRGYFLKKYPEFDFAVVAFDADLKDSRHAAASCLGGVLLKTGNRNSVVAGRPRRPETDFRKVGEDLMKNFPHLERQRDFGQAILTKFGGKLIPACTTVKMIAAVGTSADLCVATDWNHLVKQEQHIHKCRTRLCILHKKVRFTLLLFG